MTKPAIVKALAQEHATQRVAQGGVTLCQQAIRVLRTTAQQWGVRRDGQRKATTPCVCAA